MLIKKAADLRYSEVTPKSVYLNRRKFLAAAPAAFLAVREAFSPSGRAAAATTLTNLGEEPVQHHGAGHLQEDRHPLQQFLRVRHQQGRARQVRAKFQDLAVDRLGGRRSGKAAQVLHGRDHEAGAARRAHLPPSLRGGLVDRGAVGRLLAERAAEAGRAHAQGQIRGVRKLLTTTSQMPEPRTAAFRLPYVEGLRLDEAMHPLALLMRGHVRRRRCRRRMARQCAWCMPWKYGFKSIKSLVKISWWRSSRPPPGTSPTRTNTASIPTSTPRWTIPAGARPRERRLGELHRPADADVQRIWRPGGQPLRRHGPEEILLSHAAQPLDQIAVFLLCLVPQARLAGALGSAWRWRFLSRANYANLNTSPTSPAIGPSAWWCITLAVTPLRRLLHLPDLIRFRRMFGLFAFFYGSLPLRHLVRAG